VQRAGEILKNIEQGEFSQDGSPTIAKSKKAKKRRRKTHPNQLSLFPHPENDAIRKYLSDLDADELSPRQALDAAAMHRAAQALLGEQDFSSFRAAGCQAKHPMRQVQRVQVERQGDMVWVDIRANAFLHHMVRNIVGSLIRVGMGEQAESWLAELLAKRDRTQAAETAPAAGLYFITAFYPDALQIPRRGADCVVWTCAEVKA